MRLLISVLLVIMVYAVCAGGDPTTPKAAVPGSSVALSAGSAASCAVRYDMTTLAERAFAFDGTVAAVSGHGIDGFRDGDRVRYVDVTFEVHDWFRAGGRDEVTVQMFPPGMLTTIENPAYEIGSRLLISGESQWDGQPLDDAVAQYCGFSRTYDEATAARWREAFE